MAKPTRTQIIKSVIFTLIGATPGTILFFNDDGAATSVAIGCLGALIAFAFSLRGVSVSRVLAGTAGALVAHNVPRSMQGKVFEAFIGENGEPQNTAVQADDEATTQ